VVAKSLGSSNAINAAWATIEALKSLRTPEVIATAAKLNADVEPASSAMFGAFLAKEYDKWSEVVRSAGIKIE